MVAGFLVVLTAVSLIQVPALAAGTYRPPPPDPIKPLPVSDVVAAKPARTAMRDVNGKPAPEWPAPGVTDVDLSAAASIRHVGGLPVAVGAGRAFETPGFTFRAVAPATGRLRVETLDRVTTAKAGVSGVLIRISNVDTAVASIKLRIGYRGFATAYGGDWASRLRLEALPACALSTPQARACVPTPLVSRNDPRTQTVSATLPGSSLGLVALTAGPEGPAGDFAATSLQPSSTWSAGGSSGAFSWSYPMRVPPAIGGPAPELGLSYSSQSVDGRNAASNNQPSWVGEGFDASVGGFIERRYRGCAQDMDGSANNDEETGDLCWETDNATLSLGAHAGELIYNATEQRWHLRADDGSRIEHKTGAVNGDNDGEYWVVTTTDGTQYWFGANRLPGWNSGDPVTSSTFTAPVFGNDPGEPCHATAFVDSDCVQAWRWSLDYVIDVYANSASYWYVKETNKYARNNDPADAASYDRSGYLDRISYGTRRDGGVESVLDGPAPAQVVFGVADRCLTGCETHDELRWPDTPWDQECTGAPCTSVRSATFWSVKRLSTVTTQVRDGAAWQDVDRWTLTHTFPDPGDGTRAGLWLSKISHAGLVGPAASVPDVELTGVQLANRVDTIDFAAAMNWWRIAMIRNETGGTISVTYSAPECVAGQPPTPETNTKRCYPVRWTPEGYQDPVTDWFHKYVVTTVYEQDNTGGVPPQGSPRTVYTYSYLDGAAWHYSDDDGLIDPDLKTWSGYRGYGRVGVTMGDPGEQTYNETRYFRGMHGDRATAAGGTKTVAIDGFADEDWFAGIARETKRLDGPGGAVVSREVDDPWGSAATATRTINGSTVSARFSRVTTKRSHTTLDGERGERVARTTATFDSLGMAVQVDDYGQEVGGNDEQCAKTDYTPRNDTIWLMDRVHRTQTYAVACSATAGTLGDADVIAEKRNWFDGASSFETAPVRGLVTKTAQMAAWGGGAPTFTTVATAAYDIHGRATSSWDAMNARTTTAYTPATGGPVTGTTITNPLLHVTTTTLDPAWGLPTSTLDPNSNRTDLAYDGLGRLKAMWMPGRSAPQPANITFGYLVRNDAATVISTAKLNADGAYVTSYELYDGLLRRRQTQAASPSEGRIVSDTFYDSARRQVKVFGGYHATGAPGPTLVTATDPTTVPNQSRTIYDGAGRVVAEVFQPYDVERWRTSTAYGGDRTDVTPPAGGTAVSAIVDSRERTIALRQYHGPAPTPGTPGSWETTTYTFNRKGELAGLTDAAGNAWTYTYDIRGRQVTINDPDKGQTTNTYDNAGRVTSTTDARDKKLVFVYDPLGRKRAAYENAVSGTPRAQWVYDTIAKGKLSRTTRFVGTAPYQVKILGYTSSYQPTGTQVVVPASETGLAGTYNFSNSYNLDGSLASQSLPSTNGDLPSETLTYTYDGLGQPTTMSSIYGTTNLSYVAGTAYNALGLVDQITLDTDASAGGRVYVAYTRELETGRLTGIRTDRDTLAPNTLADVRYGYDDAGNVTRAADVTPDPADDTQCFRHDHLRRLTDAWTPASGDCATPPAANALGGPAPYWHSWTFDTASVGNRATQVVHATGGDTTTDYTYPAPGTAQPHMLTAASTGGTTHDYRYDAAGNTTCRPSTGAANTCPSGTGSQVLTWDPEGRLDTSTDSTGTTTHIYDADGTRLIRRDPTGKTLYLPGQEIRYTTATGSTACTRYYQYNGSTIASRRAVGLVWLSSDQQGTAAISITADAAQVATVRRQNPYGNPRGTNPTWANDKGFVGGTIDNTGLTHLGAREYDPAIGRFVSVDPVFDSANPQSWTGYAYAGSTPVTQSDPSGLMYDIGDGGSGSSSSSSNCDYANAYAQYYCQIANGEASRDVTAGSTTTKHPTVGDIIDGEIREASGGTVNGLGDWIDDACDNVLSRVECTFLRREFERAINDSWGKPFDCDLFPDAAQCKSDVSSWLHTMYEHIEFAIGFCADICINLEFQGGYIQLTVGVGSAGVGGTIVWHSAAYGDQAAVSGAVCAADGVGLCGGLGPTTDHNGNWDGTYWSAGVAFGAGDMKPALGYTVGSYNIHTGEWEILPDPWPPGVCRMAWWC